MVELSTSIASWSIAEERHEWRIVGTCRTSLKCGRGGSHLQSMRNTKTIQPNKWCLFVNFRVWGQASLTVLGVFESLVSYIMDLMADVIDPVHTSICIPHMRFDASILIDRLWVTQTTTLHLNSRNHCTLLVESSFASRARSAWNAGMHRCVYKFHG